MLSVTSIYKSRHASSFGGLWMCPSPRMVGGDDYMFIDEERGRMLVFVALNEVPIERMPMRGFYQVEPETCLRTKLWNRENWQTLPCRLEGNTLYLAYNGGWYGWERVAPEEFPAWLDKGVTLAYSRLWLNPNVNHPDGEFTAALQSMSVAALLKLQESLECRCPSGARESVLVEKELARRAALAD